MTEPDHWFEDLADYMGETYLRYSFTKGTANEVAFLIDELRLEPGMRLLDVGCGPGRHALAFAEAGIHVTGIDISQRFVDIANAAAEERSLDATFLRVDARHLDFSNEFDVTYSLCQGAFGILAGPSIAETSDPDLSVLAGMAAATRPGGRVVCSAFSAPFLLSNAESPDFDVSTGIHHETTTVHNEQGAERDFELWTTCFTPRELRLLFAKAMLDVGHLWSVNPGDYARRPPDLEHAEFLVVAETSAAGMHLSS
jgi:SAM-dependent methyltransferase